MNEHDQRRLDRVTAAVLGAGLHPEIRQFAASTRTAAEAAAALGCDVGAIANSLIFACDGGPLLILASGAHRVDTDAVAAQLGCGSMIQATPSFVREHTGQVIGGVAPVGHPAPIRTAVDRALATYPVVWASAGTPNSVFSTTFDELIQLTSGTPVDAVVG